MRRAFMVVTLVIAAMGMSGGVASATPGPTGDQGLVGACNMLNSHALPGMAIAASHANQNGFNGMGIAVINTNGSLNCFG